MMRVPERYRLPIAIVASVAVVAVVLVIVLVGGGAGPLATATPSPSPTASPIDPTSTPEGAVRAMFEAFAEARPTNDPSLVLPFVTSEDSPAYLSVRGFLEGQQGLGRAAVITEQRFDDVSVDIDEATATVRLVYRETGYPIDAETGEPLGPPGTIEPTRVVARVVLVGSQWLIEQYESTP
jgi:hypothetical protein